MKKIAFAVIAGLAFANPAFADAELSKEEAEKATAAATAWGCEGGEWEKETEGTGLYELDDAKCKDGRAYDLKFDKDFNLMTIVKD